MKTDETRDSDAEIVVLRLPTEAAEHPISAAIAECLVNVPDDSLEGRTPWEVSRASAAQAHGWVETRSESGAVKAIMRRLLDEADSRGRMIAAYERSGGLLNLFNEPPAASDDDTWETLRTQHGERDAVELWHLTPNPLFAELTPAEVWAGGGVRERELLTLFLRSYSSFSREFNSPSLGTLVKSSCSMLRTWTIIPQQGMRATTPREEIRQERRAILERKLALLSR